VKPSRRLDYRLHVDFEADRQHLNLAFQNNGRLGVGVQARSQTVTGGPFSYTVGAGHDLGVQLPNPGTYDLSLHGPNGFFRHFAGSPASVLQVQVRGDDGSGRLLLRIAAGESRRPVVVQLANAFGRDRRFTLRGPEAIVIDTRGSGGWYDVALTSPDDDSFGYQLAGRLESNSRLTSDPQLGRT
jgi:phospholipase C